MTAQPEIASVSTSKRRTKRAARMVREQGKMRTKLVPDGSVRRMIRKQAEDLTGRKVKISRGAVQALGFDIQAYALALLREAKTAAAISHGKSELVNLRDLALGARVLGIKIELDDTNQKMKAQKV